jgi:hypothetical protein
MKPALALVCLLLVACNAAPTGVDNGAVLTPAPLDSPTSTAAPSLTAPLPSPTEEPASTATLTPLPSATPAPSLTPTVTPEPALPEGAIRWDEAASHTGEKLTVCGPVIRATFASDTNGQPTFIDVGKGYPETGRFSVLIWGKYRYKFPEPPETAYLNRYVCVSGLVVSYKGEPEVEVNDPGKIWTIDD